MDRWEGVIRAKDLQMNAVVYYQAPSNEYLGEWYGTGISEKYWPIEQKQFETNIGTIIITHQTIESDEYFIEFQGSGEPKGSLAIKIGLVK